MPDGGPFRVPGADGVAGFGLGALVDDIGMGDDPEGVAAAIVPPVTGVAIIVQDVGHEGPVSVASICRLWDVEQYVSVTKA